jgi:hypothetical protein
VRAGCGYLVPCAVSLLDARIVEAVVVRIRILVLELPRPNSSLRPALEVALIDVLQCLIQAKALEPLLVHILALPRDELLIGGNVAIVIRIVPLLVIAAVVGPPLGGDGLAHLVEESRLHELLHNLILDNWRETLMICCTDRLIEGLLKIRDDMATTAAITLSLRLNWDRYSTNVGRLTSSEYQTCLKRESENERKTTSIVRRG